VPGGHAGAHRGVEPVVRVVVARERRAARPVAKVDDRVERRSGRREDVGAGRRRCPEERDVLRVAESAARGVVVSHPARRTAEALVPGPRRDVSIDRESLARRGDRLGGLVVGGLDAAARGERRGGDDDTRQGERELIRSSSAHGAPLGGGWEEGAAKPVGDEVRRAEDT